VRACVCIEGDGEGERVKVEAVKCACAAHRLDGERVWNGRDTTREDGHQSGIWKDMIGGRQQQHPKNNAKSAGKPVEGPLIASWVLGIGGRG
jgi:hypothetical protein